MYITSVYMLHSTMFNAIWKIVHVYENNGTKNAALSDNSCHRESDTEPMMHAIWVLFSMYEENHFKVMPEIIYDFDCSRTNYYLQYQNDFRF